MREEDKGTYRLTINGISRDAAKRLVENWAGGELVWAGGKAYPVADSQPCVIEPMAPPGMPTPLQEVMNAMPQLPQRQDATNDQLRDLRYIANKLGLYDAADYLRVVLKQE